MGGGLVSILKSGASAAQRRLEIGYLKVVCPCPIMVASVLKTP
jgi:hypothetical protein